MKKFITRLHNYFIPASYRVNEEEFRKARIFINSTLITSCFAFFFLLNTLVFRMHYHIYSMIVCTIGFFLLAYFPRWKFPIITAAHLFVALAVCATFWDAFFLGGLQSYDFPWMCLPPVMAVLFGNSKIGWIWLIITLIAVTAMGILQLTGTQFPNAIDPKYFHIHGLNSLISLVLIMFIIVLVMESAFIGSLKKLDAKNKVIEEEKKRSDDLLLNILPAEVVNELKLTGKTTARNYDLVTVLFADFKNFTTVIEEMPPEELVSGIDQYFETFDKVVAKYEIEKIKTVGDAYICASGLPVENMNNAILITEAALDMRDEIERLRTLRHSQGKVAFEVRIGIHSGPVVAGVVGIKKFAYDIWGDTVNTAARMEQNGEAGKINISGTTHDLIKHRFQCTPRGRMEVKHKGEIEMYFVEGKK